MRSPLHLALRVLVAVALFLSTRTVSATPSPAETPSPADEAFDRKIQDELAALDPDAVPIMKEADRASFARDLEAAARGYQEVLLRVPTFVHATRRLCGIEVARGRGLELCRRALELADTPENHAAMAMALVASKDPSLGEIHEAQLHARTAVAKAPNDPNAYRASCVVASASRSAIDLSLCSAALVRLEGQDPFSHFYAAMSAGAEGRLDDAEASLERARALGLPEPIYTDVHARLEAARPVGPIYFRWGWMTLAGWFAIFGVLFLAGTLLSASAMRASSRMPAKGDGHAHGVDGLLRRAYRVVLWVSCGFYYVSLPLLAIFMVACGGGLLYGALMVGRIPIKLLLIVGLVILSTLVAIVRSIFTRAKDVDPGERIDLREHPNMRAVLDEVAAKIGTRPVDHVYLTPFTEIAVFERGGMARQLRGSTERALVLGAGVLDGMKLRAFKGILAHEYGHFHNEDTAGGGFALAVRRSVLTMAMGLAERGAASSINPAWWFVKGFYSVFLRISQGASRLQEVLADRWAAFAYGSASFEEGMRHVVRRSLAFDAHADHTLAEVVEHKRALANLYRYTPEVKANHDDVERAFDEAWNAEPSPYDSHPRPADRIAWVRGLGAEGAPPAADDDDAAWSLFSDRAKVEEHMTGLVRLRVASATGVHLAAE
jgi:Zn-dependent protease with chaperone function